MTGEQRTILGFESTPQERQARLAEILATSYPYLVDDTLAHLVEAMSEMAVGGLGSGAPRNHDESEGPLHPEHWNASWVTESLKGISDVLVLHHMGARLNDKRSSPYKEQS